MNPIATLMRREWLQHRFGWSLLLLLPTAIALLLFSFGQLQFEAAEINERLPTALALAALAGGIALHFVMLWLTSLIIVSGIARRDHADRSIEFWLSLPTGHAPSLAVPLLVHLLLVPAAALLAGMVSGVLVSLVLVTRVSGLGTWFALPWLGLGLAGLAIGARLAVGLVLATLWLSPLILLAVLLTAWFRRWGIVILSVGIGLGSVVLERVFGQPVLTDVLGALFRNAAFSLKGPDSGSLVIDNVSDIESALAVVPGWAVQDAGQSLALLPSPLLLGALLVAAACFALLVQWRQRGAGAAG